MTVKIKMMVVRFFWKFKPVWRNYCWAYAVSWAYGTTKFCEIRKADHDCFYCLGCNTDEEIKLYRGDE